MRHDAPRPDPDILLAAAQRAERGKLRIFLGAAPGVGKTWEMLHAAQRRHAAGLDVLAGVIETHGRAETEAAIGDLPILPRRDMPVAGMSADGTGATIMKEFDVDAALARRPALLLVDELAHTNITGSRHAKRWEDVTELLDAGIDVWATLNIQHIESLNDTVARITGIRVAETLPDSVLEQASEIELIDLTPAELRNRLADGHIYRPDIATRALGGFFREGNLAALRELALRRAAQHVDADLRDYMRANAIAGPWPASERVLVLVDGSRASAAAAIRHAKLLADGLHAPWTALIVERGPGDAPRLAPAITLATRLGADIETRAGDVAGQVRDLALRLQATILVLGRTDRTRARLARMLPGLAISLAPSPPAGTMDRGRRMLALASLLASSPPRAFDWLLPPALTAGTVLLGIALRGVLEHEALGMIFLGGVVLAATFRGLVIGLATALAGFLAWNWFFIPPVDTFSIDEPRDFVAIVVFAGVAVAAGLLAARLRRAELAAQSRIEGLKRVGGFARALGTPATEPELMAEIARQAATVAARALVLTPRGEDLDIAGSAPAADTMDEGSWAAARWAFRRGEETGSGTATLPSAAWRFLPMRSPRGVRGLLGVQQPSDGLDATALQTLSSLADQAAISVERIALLAEAARAEAGAETQRLRTALLNSLSHDLRTPLAGIQGAAGTLRFSWSALTDDVRADLLASIEEDTQRMARFLGNVMDMTRLESGQIEPKRLRCTIAACLEEAASRVPGAIIEHGRVPPGLAVTADPLLLEQVLVNLLDNATRYAPQGATVTCHATSDAHRATLVIADGGVGIPPEELELVFDSFYRARRGDRVAPGTGLGLAIARGLMEAMGGTITAASPCGRTATGLPGTEMTLVLPLAPTLAARGEDADGIGDPALGGGRFGA